MKLLPRYLAIAINRSTQQSLSEHWLEQWGTHQKMNHGFCCHLEVLPQNSVNICDGLTGISGCCTSGKPTELPHLPDARFEKLLLKRGLPMRECFENSSLTTPNSRKDLLVASSVKGRWEVTAVPLNCGCQVPLQHSVQGLMLCCFSLTAASVEVWSTLSGGQQWMYSCTTLISGINL